MNCPKCGKSILDDALECPFCRIIPSKYKGRIQHPSRVKLVPKHELNNSLFFKIIILLAKIFGGILYIFWFLLTKQQTKNRTPLRKINNSQNLNRKYHTLGEWEKDLTVLWEGDTPIINFKYEKFDEGKNKYIKQKRMVNVKQILRDSRNLFYLKGFDYKRLEDRTFKIDRIISKITTDAREYDIYEWLDEKNAFDF
jgi:hypothetical protein